ncbi:MAG TPA: GatB/YqeY domain-containing protein [Stellaceae bacterium]|nr:GatB/YqeY domain-containing protein [Stellaceae bacterium]
MLRQRFTDTLKEAMKAREELTVSTVRLIIAKLKEQDIEARGRGKPEGIGEPEIQQMLQGMIKQRRDSIVLYEQGKRADLVAKEQGEIAVIERFLPQQMGEAELEGAVKALIGELGAQGMKDMGRVMAALKERHAGRFDGGKASQMVKRLLG